MTVDSLIAVHINWNTKIMKATVYPDNRISVKFYLSVPAWVNDKDLIKQENQSIIYSCNKKMNTDRFEVKLATLDEDYPKVGNNKSFTYTKIYKAEEFLKIGDIKKFMTSEREKVFRETRSNILLEQIGELTKKWTDVSEGKFFKSEKKNYALAKQAPYIWHTLSYNAGTTLYTDTTISGSTSVNIPF